MSSKPGGKSKGKELRETKGDNSQEVSKAKRARKQRVRGRFRDVAKKQQTALVRQLRACIRCRLQKIRVSIFTSKIPNTVADLRKVQS